MAGAGHALAPGHGKTMVAAYLVGSQGTPQQAIWLGAITTFTHTIGVFILGIVVLCLSRYVLPEQLYPLLSLFSGLTVCGGGFWLLDRQLDPASESSFSSHSHHHEHVHGDYHHQAAPRSLLALGVAGGLVPCPSALVLLLSAIALHHTAYGLLLVSAFSLGLAVILVAIGLSVIYAQKWFKLVPALQPWRHYIPVVGAISVIIAGSFITACAVI
jgi:nickel/cobalt exporter